MSGYQVIARKYRPQRFEEVVGQDHVTRTLSHAISKERIAHAYLFCGPRGTGKTTLARIFAKCLNCTDGPKTDFPDDDPRCKEISEGRSLDVIEIDGASNRGIEEIRELRDTVNYAPAVSPYKIFIIDEVHMLTKEAFNALLKTLEEPPEHVKFMFATTEPEKVLPTILSRCQRFDLRRIAAPQIVLQLKKIADSEGIQIEEAALQAIARGADGGMRDAQSTLDQLISFCGDQVEEKDVLSMFGLTSRDQILRLSEAIIHQDNLSILNELRSLVQNGKDLGRLLLDLQEYFRHLMIFKVSKSKDQLEGLSEAELESLIKHAKGLSDHQVLRLLEALSETDYRLREASAKRIAVEVGLIKAAESLASRSMDEVIRTLKDLKQQTPTSTQGPEPRQTTSPAPTRNRQSPPASSVGTPRPSPPSPPQPPAPAPVAAPKALEARPDTPKNVFSSDINLHSVWNQLLQKVGKDNPFLHSYLADGHPLEMDGQVIIVGYPLSQVDQMEMVDNKKNHQAIESLLEALGYPGLKLRLIRSEKLQPLEKPTVAINTNEETSPDENHSKQQNSSNEPSNGAPKVPIDPEEFLNDPLIKQALEVFKGRMLKVESST
jgi:DNA polymerase-3 subunit gamma/tau